MQTIIYFIFIGFITEPIKKDMNINIFVNLMKWKDLVEEAVYIANQMLN